MGFRSEFILFSAKFEINIFVRKCLRPEFLVSQVCKIFPINIPNIDKTVKIFKTRAAHISCQMITPEIGKHTRKKKMGIFKFKIFHCRSKMFFFNQFILRFILKTKLVLYFKLLV